MTKEEKELIPYYYDNIMESEKWVNEIPFIKFKKEWEVKIIPPLRGATVRFLVKLLDREVSVYLDCHNRLASMENPYWEIYPYDNDIFRCDMNDTESLLKAIEHTLGTINTPFLID